MAATGAVRRGPAAAREAARRLHGRRVRRARDPGATHRRAAGAPHLPQRGRGPGARHGLDRIRAGDALVQSSRRAGRLCIAKAPAVASAQSAGHGGGEPGLGVQYGDELRHEHELAGLWRRIDDELSHADAHARRTELRLRGDRDGRARRADPRLRAQGGGRHRQFLDRPRSHDGLHPAAAGDRPVAGAGEPGRPADFR